MATYTGSDRRLAYLFANGGGGGGSCKVISGYYHNGDFYEDQSYTQIITGDTECLYIDLDTTTLYLFDGTDYVEVQGGGGSGGGSFACDLLFENTNLTPSGTSNVNKEFTLSRSIENYDCVLVMTLGYVNSTLQEQSGTMLIPKSDYYKRAIGESGDTAIRWAFDIDISVPTGRRTLAFGFYDSTHIYTASRNSESGVEPMLYKVYGMNFGGSLHTYSTTEQVVGTWIDGKPIYECVFDLGSDTSVSSTAWYSTGITIPSLSNILQVWSTNSTGTFYPLMAYHNGGNINIEACRDGNPATVRWLCFRYTKSTT